MCLRCVNVLLLYKIDGGFHVLISYCCTCYLQFRLDERQKTSALRCCYAIQSKNISRLRAVTGGIVWQKWYHCTSNGYSITNCACAVSINMENSLSLPPHSFFPYPNYDEVWCWMLDHCPLKRIGIGTNSHEQCTTQLFLCKKELNIILWSHGETNYFHLLGYKAAQSVESQPMFLRNMSPPSSGSKKPE
jgi:hypothetical protein